MKIFEYKRLFNRINLRVFGVKLHFRLPIYKKNFYVSLGTNCFPRLKLTTYGLKAKKKQGELSCPFDLAWTPLSSTLQILKNDFKDYLENFEFDANEQMWKNSKYNITYPHDGDISLEKMISRYQNRIENFRNVVMKQPKLMFVLADFNRTFNPEVLNSIFEYLVEVRSGLPFRFFVISFVDKNSPVKNVSLLNPNIIYKEYEPTCTIAEFLQLWFTTNNEEDVIIAPIKDIEKYSNF